jgi:uncharacterized membrane protein
MLIMMALKYFASIMDPISDKKDSVPSSAANAAQPASAKPIIAVGEPDGNELIDDELVAVITAAIAAECAGNVKIAGISQASTHKSVSLWRMAGIYENAHGQMRR